MGGVLQNRGSNKSGCQAGASPVVRAPGKITGEVSRRSLYPLHLPKKNVTPPASFWPEVPSHFDLITGCPQQMEDVNLAYSFGLRSPVHTYFHHNCMFEPAHNCVGKEDL